MSEAVFSAFGPEYDEFSKVGGGIFLIRTRNTSIHDKIPFLPFQPGSGFVTLFIHRDDENLLTPKYLCAFKEFEYMFETYDTETTTTLVLGFELQLGIGITFT